MPSSVKGDGDKLVFLNEAGKALSYTNWRTRVWKPATERAGVAGLRYHDLRTARHRLGHTTPAMTLAVYSWAAIDRDREAADAVASRMAPGRSGHGT